MENIVKEYIRNNQMKNHQLGQDNTLKKKKPLTYNEIKKTIDSMSDFNKSESKPHKKKNLILHTEGQAQRQEVRG